jgi:hypothetical protein
MGILLGTTLVLIALGVLVYPFLNRRKHALAGDPSVERLRVARMRVYRQIADIESDFQSGELTQADYEAQFRELRLAAARTLQEEERLGVAVSDEDLLEREVQAARRSKAGPPEGGDTLG